MSDFLSHSRSGLSRADYEQIVAHEVAPDWNYVMSATILAGLVCGVVIAQVRILIAKTKSPDAALAKLVRACS